MIRKEPSPNQGKTYVTFEFPDAAWVKEVHLVGDFNEWEQTSLPLAKPTRGDLWRIRLEMHKGQAYEFRYLVNQLEWHNDWHADRYVPNIHGSDNSVVIT